MCYVYVRDSATTCAEHCSDIQKRHSLVLAQVASSQMLAPVT